MLTRLVLFSKQLIKLACGGDLREALMAGDQLQLAGTVVDLDLHLKPRGALSGLEPVTCAAPSFSLCVPKTRFGNIGDEALRE
jgi:hypothetical protein